MEKLIGEIMVKLAALDKSFHEEKSYIRGKLQKLETLRALDHLEISTLIENVRDLIKENRALLDRVSKQEGRLEAVGGLPRPQSAVDKYGKPTVIWAGAGTLIAQAILTVLEAMK